VEFSTMIERGWSMAMGKNTRRRCFFLRLEEYKTYRPTLSIIYRLKELQLPLLNQQPN